MKRLFFFYLCLTLVGCLTLKPINPPTPPTPPTPPVPSGPDYIGYIAYISYKSGTLNKKTTIKPTDNNITETVLFGYLNSLHMSNVESNKHLPDDGKFRVQVFDKTTQETVQNTGTTYDWAVYVPTTLPSDSDSYSEWIKNGLFDPTTLEANHDYDLKLLFTYNGEDTTISIPMKLELVPDPDKNSQGVLVPNFLHNVVLETPSIVIETIDGRTWTPDASIPFDHMNEMHITGKNAPALASLGGSDPQAPDNGKTDIYVLDGNCKLMQLPIKDANWTNAVCVKYGCTSVNWVSDNHFIDPDVFNKFTPNVTYYIYLVFTYNGQASHIQIPVHRTGK